MTSVTGILVAFLAGWLITRPRRAALVALAPWLAILGFQTAVLAAGLGVSPPDTVRQPSYWVVQAVDLAAVLVITVRLSRWRARRIGDEAASPAALLGRTRLAAVLCAVAAVATVAANEFARPVFSPGSVKTHTGGGSPLVPGVLCLMVSVLLLIVLAAASLRARLSAARAGRAVRQTPPVHGVESIQS